MKSPVVAVGEDTSTNAIAALLERHGISAVAVRGEGESLLGVVSSTDLVRAVASGGSFKAKDVMAAPAVIATPHENVDDAAFRMVAARVHRLFVVEHEKLVGILSARDVLEEVKSRRIDAPIRAIMSTPVVTASAEEPVARCVDRLATAGVHGLVVVDGSFPVGVFTHAEAIAARGLPPSLRNRPVEDVMSYETICLDAATPIHRAAGHLIAMNVRRILVVEARHLVGIASVVDLVGVLARAPAA